MGSGYSSQSDRLAIRKFLFQVATFQYLATFQGRQRSDGGWDVRGANRGMRDWRRHRILPHG